VRVLRLVAGLVAVMAGAASAQLAIQQPTVKLLILPLNVKSPAESAASIATSDAARTRLEQLAKYKVQVIPKTKYCEALRASDFACDVLLDETQAKLLASFLNVNAYTTGTLDHSGGLTAHMRVRDIGSSGYGSLFTVSSGNPATPAALGEAIAQKLSAIVRAGEHVRECTDARSKSQFQKALDAARKALAIEPTLPGAYFCIATVYEAQRMSVDSQLAAYQRAAAIDTLNATAWENVARLYQQKGDTLKAIDAFAHELQGEPQNANLRLAVAELLRLQKQYQRAVTVLDAGLVQSAGDQRMIESRQKICIEGELWRCVVDGFATQLQTDTAKQADSTLLKAAIGAAQQIADTGHLLLFARIASRHFPRSAAFLKALGAAFDLKGQKDSSLWAYRQSLAIDPSDVGNALLVAKAMVEAATYDTAQAGKLKGDTVALRQLRTAFADRLDSARVYLDRAATSPDSGAQVNAAALMRTAGEKLIRAGAADRALPWLSRTLSLIAPRSPADTVGVRQAIRVNASFWYGLAAMSTLPAEYQAMTKAKSCTEAKAFNDRLAQVRAALTLGRSVHPPTVDNTLQTLAKFEGAMASVKKAFKCHNF
jgi:tetratricopeptide (TPR) repeat protein